MACGIDKEPSRRARALTTVLVAVLCTTSVAWADPERSPSVRADRERQRQQKQAALDLRRVWKFDDQTAGGPPGKFAELTLGTGPAGVWTVVSDPSAASAPHVLRQGEPCGDSTCVHVLLAEGVTYDYFDLTVKLRPDGGAASGIGGVVFSAQDAQNFYAVLVDFGQGSMTVIRVEDGRETELGRAPLTKRDGPWHIMRVQRNTIISKEFIEAFFDHTLTLSVEAQTFRNGRIGLATRGSTPVEFDSIHAIRIYSQRPLSSPAAY